MADLLLRKQVHGIELISNDGKNWVRATPADLLTPAESLRRARLFDEPKPERRPYGRKKMVVKSRKSTTKRLINRPVMTLRKKAHQAQLDSLRRDAAAPRCELQHIEKPPKPKITRGGEYNLIHVYSDIYSHIDRDWFHERPTGMAAKTCLDSVLERQ